MTRTYFCIDMKSFYASVECAERSLNPFETSLVVADESRGKSALCLAISPKLKALGVSNRCRLSDIPKNISYLIAPPRMQLYIDYAAEIYSIYTKFISPSDIHVYSIDESFIDATDYIEIYDTDGVCFAKKLMNEIASKLRIPATAGVGTNLFLAKIALDITAKHTKDRIGYLNEELFKKTLWDHKPITDFWQISAGTSKRLEKCGIRTMKELAAAPKDLIYRLFGINAELLIDHANGRENCLINDIKSYKSKSRSVSLSQILPRNYSFDEAHTVMDEMILKGCHELLKMSLAAKKIWIGVGYSYGNLEMTHGTAKFEKATYLFSEIEPVAEKLFVKTALANENIRRLEISFSETCDESCIGFDFFTDWEKVNREKARELAVLEIKERFGKNALLRGTDFMPEATQRERNEMIGGHRAGFNDNKQSADGK